MLRRWLVNIIMVASLVLSVATAAAWMRSYFRSDLIYHVASDGSRLGVDSGLGSVALSTEQLNPRFAGEPGFHWWIQAAAKPVFGGASSVWERMGFWSIALTTSSSAGHRWVIPYWVLAAMSLLIPSLRLWSWWRLRYRLPPGFCPACGYDLRATPEQCPECGTVRRPGDER